MNQKFWESHNEAQAAAQIEYDQHILGKDDENIRHTKQDRASITQCAKTNHICSERRNEPAF